MDEANDDYQERLEGARLIALVTEIGVRVWELGVLLSALEAVAHSFEFQEGGVPSEELAGVPDPREILYSEDAITTGEAVEVLVRFLDMSAEGKARLWGVLNLASVIDNED